MFNGQNHYGEEFLKKKDRLIDADSQNCLPNPSANCFHFELVSELFDLKQNIHKKAFINLLSYKEKGGWEMEREREGRMKWFCAKQNSIKEFLCNEKVCHEWIALGTEILVVFKILFNLNLI